MRTENIFEEKIEVGHRKRKYLEKEFFAFQAKMPRHLFNIRLESCSFPAFYGFEAVVPFCLE